MPEKYAILIACDKYSDPDLKQLKAPSQDTQTLSKLLEDARIGNFTATSLVNQPHFIVNQKIEEILLGTTYDDMILIYFSCHGIKDINGHLHYAMTNTNKEQLFSTAIESSFVNKMMDLSKARKKILLLDCCYSGAYKKGTYVRADKNIHTNEYFGSGKVVITASDSMQYAFEGDEIKNIGTSSYFTAALINGIQNGKADINQDGKITPEELYQFVDDYVRKEKPEQTPSWNCDGVKGDFVLFNNPNLTMEPAEKIVKKEIPQKFSSIGIQQLLEKSIQHYLEKNYSTAVHRLETLLDLNPNNLEAKKYLSRCFFKMNDYDESIKYCNQILEINPRDIEILEFKEDVMEKKEFEEREQVRKSQERKEFEEREQVRKSQERKEIEKKWLEEEHQISLKIFETYSRDIGRGVARIDNDAMEKLKISSGEIMGIKGRKRIIPVKCLPLYPADEGKDIIRIDGLSRENSGNDVGDIVSIRKIKALNAEKVIVAPLEDSPLIDERYIAESLENISVVIGDNVMIPYFGGRLTFQVIQTVPNATVVLVTQRTAFMINTDYSEIEK